MSGTATFSCGRGHRWVGNGTLNPDAPPVCPTCGGMAIPATISGDSLNLSSYNSDSDATLPRAKSISDSQIIRPEVPGFTIERELGRGGMGVVYLARQQELNRLVALKMILAGAHAGPRERERFRIEAQAAAQLQHPNIVQIHEIGEVAGHPYLALEYVPGGSLAAELKGVPWSARDAARVIEPIARAIHHAHQRGIVHRDLKPANVLMSLIGTESKPGGTPAKADGWPPMAAPKITDFGLAKQLNEMEATSDKAGPTRSGAVMGTPSYIAPEQASGRTGMVGPLADVYSLGAILYEMLTGRPPFRGETPLDTVLQVMSDDPIPPRRLHPRVPRDLETICLKCLQKEPWRRYGSAAELAEDLRRFLRDEPILARPVSALNRLVKWARRKPALALLIAGIIAAVVSGFVIELKVNFELNAAAERERRQAQEATKQKLLAQEAAEKAERLRADADQQRRNAERETNLARRSLYALQLAQVATLSDRDPRQALQLLDNDRRCPPDLCDFTWGFLHQACRRERRALAGHLSTVSAVAYSPDGHWLVSAGWDRTLRLWVPSISAAPLTTVTAHEGLVLSLAVSPDGRTIATAGDDKTIKLWSVQRPVVSVGPGVSILWPIPRLREKAVLTGHQGDVRAVAFSPDGTTLASGGYDFSVRLWDLHRNKELVTLRKHTRVVWSLAFSPDGKMLASGSEDQSIILWDTAWLSDRDQVPVDLVLGTLQGHTDGVVALAFSPDGKTLASGGNFRDQTLRLWDVARRRERARLKGHIRAIFAVAFAPDGQTLATGSADSTIRLWDPTSGRERTVLQGHVAQIHALAFSPDSRLLSSGGADRVIRQWNVDEHREETYQINFTRLGQIQVSPDAKKVIFADSGALESFDIASRTTAALTGQGMPAVLLTSSSGVVAALDSAGNCQIWRRGQPAGVIPKLEAVRCLALSPDGRQLAAGTAKGELLLFDLDNFQQLAQLANAHQGAVTALAFSADGKLLASAGADRSVRIWDPARKAPIQTLIAGNLNEVRSLVFAPNSSTLAGGAIDGMIALWKVNAAEPPTMLNGHTDAITTLAFTADGQALASGSDDRTIKLWDAITGQERATLAGHTDQVVSLAFNADATLLVAASRDGAVKFWQADRRPSGPAGSATGTRQQPRQLELRQGSFARLASPERRFHQNHGEDLENDTKKPLAD